MFPLKSAPTFIFRRALMFRSLHHLLCVLDVLAVFVLPLVALSVLLVLHLVVWVMYLGAMSAALARLAASNDAASGIASEGGGMV